jgi:hypothetical protein
MPKVGSREPFEGWRSSTVQMLEKEVDLGVSRLHAGKKLLYARGQPVTLAIDDTLEIVLTIEMLSSRRSAQWPWAPEPRDLRAARRKLRANVSAVCRSHSLKTHEQAIAHFPCQAGSKNIPPHPERFCAEKK